MLKKSWTPRLVLLVSQGVSAQSLPSAGAQLQQMPVIPAQAYRAEGCWTGLLAKPRNTHLHDQSMD